MIKKSISNSKVSKEAIKVIEKHKTEGVLTRL